MMKSKIKVKVKRGKKKKKKTSRKNPQRPGTARVREVGKVIKQHPAVDGEEEDESTAMIRSLALSLEEAALSLPSPSPFTTHRKAMAMSGPTDRTQVSATTAGPSLFSGAYEEMVRLEHMIIRGDIVLRECEAFLPSTENEEQAEMSCPEKKAQDLLPQTADTVTFLKGQPPAMASPKPPARVQQPLPPAILKHPLAAAASLSAITRVLKDLNASQLTETPLETDIREGDSI
mmetsp:Transcript_33468/g.39316  ORF Transcript_33468/g.39316 Transcript_33468/m.39316 type:complete len:232 (+) Transcript_33468:273-968(+)